MKAVFNFLGVNVLFFYLSLGVFFLSEFFGVLKFSSTTALLVKFLLTPLVIGILFFVSIYITDRIESYLKRKRLLKDLAGGYGR